MSENKSINPNYIFETSWEVCNKVGGIYTVISSKALTLVNEYKDNYILIGPDILKETHNNIEFIEDKHLHSSWREKAEEEGLHFRIGRWNIAGNPIVILVDFTSYFSNKNEIFAHFWEKYKLDSITGQWDYVEPVLFGYAAGKIIESFYNFYLSAYDKIIAQFHEWMTGTGILYLKEKMPQAACVFTTHATVLGRSIAGNSLPLYKNLDSYNLNAIANDFGIRSKYSLEKLAANHSDSFTTVSDITAKECEKLLQKKVDVITPNGFEYSFVPSKEDFQQKRKIAKNKLFEVAEALFNQKIAKESLLVINSGRYEFKNKGIDVFIDALGKLNKQESLQKNILAFITVPANHDGINKEIIQKINNKDFKNPVTDKYLTHYLNNEGDDPILKSIKANGLRNLPEDKVKIIFVPCYLNGEDGIFNLNYYDLLIGFDISVFPSYYEPWGYTPLESIAFHIPTITTTLTGFGKWVKSIFGENSNGVSVIERTDDNNIVDRIVENLVEIMNLSNTDKNKLREDAFNISKKALWKNLIVNYKKAYSIALEKVENRSDLFKNKLYPEHYTNLKKTNKKPNWGKILIKTSLPESLEPLNKLAKNLWWTWNYEASELFEMIDSKLWDKAKHNPIVLIESLSYNQIQSLEKNEVFIGKLKTVTEKFDNYMSKSVEKPKRQIAYFCMEYGLHDTIKIFSGGLGILAGDYLKQASDSNINIVGIGLIYRYGYFKQNISIFGDQISIREPQKFSHLPLISVKDNNGKWIKIHIPLPGRILYAKVWRVDVGRIPLYLLDTDIEDNSDIDKTITHALYGGNSENRLKQEMLLGIGGIRLLDAIGANPDIYHCNEGHAAFIGIERLRKYIEEENLTFSQAIELVRASSLFTTHTPVPAGHDRFNEDLIRTYLSHYPDKLNISWDDFMNLGRFNDNDHNENFSMSVLAAKLSQEMNGVSKIHGAVSQKMFNDLYKGYFPEELFINYVTNGVHYKTWAEKKWQQLYEKHFGKDFLENQSDDKYWKKIYDVPDENIWKIRQTLRKELIDYLKRRITDDLTQRQENPKLIINTREAFNENALTIGFARRFATYKRANLLFTNLERLAKIVNNKDKPVQFVYAGKAHPQDVEGQNLIKKIIEISKRPEFLGKIIFVENYDIALAKKLIPGVDIWLNTPTRPMEASGTSGEKAVMNGVVNFSVLDGWWAEGYKEKAGWAIKEAKTYANQNFQDELDAETIYYLLEEEIIPVFYDLNEKGIPVKWISYIKNTIYEIAPHFTMKRMLDDYYNKFYNKLFKRSEQLKMNNYDLAKQISLWKTKINNNWENIKIVSVKTPDSNGYPLMLGEKFKAVIVLKISKLSENDLGIEIIFGKKVNGEVKEIIFSEQMKMVHREKDYVTFVCDITLTKAGVYDYAFRIFPKNQFLPHRQDFSLVKWV
ncbi:MAG: alpha-glucan family phosphorylase [Bacteroidales bacterium]|nr:alpha-glucan family phosphorylase [Bacteroidales bacterium]